jgi:esterase/lipase superfamily enzyme
MEARRSITVDRPCPLLLLVIVALLGGCARHLVPAPNLYVAGGLEAFGDVPTEFQTNTVDVLYATDRLPKGNEQADVSYGYERSRALQWGSALVEFGRDVSWDAVVEASTTHERRQNLPLAVRSTTELGRFPETPAPLVETNGVVTVAPEHLARHDEAVAALHEELRRRLAKTARKEALVFIHGFNNTFAEGVFRAAELWHFTGREGVPVLYSWPAGHPGLLQGYTHDRESGQFTNFHLKQFLTALAACPELEKINVVAHSRGTDVASTALKELILVARARGDDPKAATKLGALVLAAADMSAEVLQQRFIAEEMREGVESVTFYVHKNDRAIGSAEWLFADKKRIGQFRPDQMGERQRERLEVLDHVAVVDSRIRTDFLGHAYFLDSPATLSDLILLLRYGRRPGGPDGRPLTEIAPNYFILDDEYPRESAPD